MTTLRVSHLGNLRDSLRADRIGDLRLRAVCAVARDTPVRDALARMSACRAGCVLVLDASAAAPAGIFTERDFVTRVVTQGRDASLPIEQVMTRDPTTVRASDTVRRAIALMGAGGYRHLPVTGDGGEPIGVLSVKDVVHYLVEHFPSRVYNLPPTPDQASPAREGA